MTRLDLRTMKISWPVLGLLAVTLGLIAFAYCRGDAERHANNDAPANAPARRIDTRAASSAPANMDAASAATASAAAASSSPASSAEAASSESAPPPVVNLFPAQSWQPPPPPPPPPEATKPPPPPPLPPLPFIVRSLWLDQRGTFYVVLSGTGREFPLCIDCRKKGFLKKGDVILNAYRIEDISRREVKFMYLPLKRRQTLPLGELK